MLSPKITTRASLCTVVALSTTEPNPKMPYHAQINLNTKLPDHFEKRVWIKGDMINAVGFHRLDLISLGKDKAGKRVYSYYTLDDQQMCQVQACVLHGMGMSKLTKHL